MTLSTAAPEIPDADRKTDRPRSRFYPWIVFILAFGLLLSDYMSRQVLSAVFPYLKTEWALSDSQLASLTSVVALMVGLLTLPISILADRWGRVKSLVLMAVLWSLATLLCAIATSYGQMLGARFLVGIGEAAYGSVGIALVMCVFAPHMRSSIGGAFMAGGSFGSVVGVGLGGFIAVQFGWRWSFVAMAVLGLVLAAAFRAAVTEERLGRYSTDEPEEGVEAQPGYRAPFRSLFSSTAVLCAYAGSGLQLFMSASLLAWLPSFFNRYYGMEPDRAGAVASFFVLFIGVGMVLCGMITDRVSKFDGGRKWTSAIAYCLISMTSFGIAFGIDNGPVQLGLMAVGAFFSAGSSGPATAMVASLTHASVRATGLGTLTLANSLLGLALGPMIVGMLADRFGLASGLQLAALVYLLAIAVLVVGKKTYPAGLRILAELSARSSH
ncbi:MFS transporter [Rhodococcus tukisamuensis]|uniref:Predicted arabinose efflux permease, MFS family n=1 Tax=Rhodococcus tukisamuensis TaxID=168276 RepID=A0A1G6S4Z1_9NOCA|nr:MFS transporter [Rhodococcus tukisamuensis]SDD11761.1 Predicted arabinose efflux permease, MFS family [Rhodococcus tukisamuensis]